VQNYHDVDGEDHDCIRLRKLLLAVALVSCFCAANNTCKSLASAAF